MLQQAFRGQERYGLVAYVKMPLESLPPEEPFPSPPPRNNLPTVEFRVFYFDVDHYIERMSDYQAAATQPYYEVRDQLMLWGKDRHLGFSDGNPAPQTFKFNSMNEASEACARVAVAATRYRLDHGKLPSRLADLVPGYLNAIPTDVFSGKPLRLAIKKDKWIVYSVGPNGVDDGGVQPNDKWDSTDVIFTLRPAGAKACTAPASQPSKSK
jgi:hypothetical protein